MTNTIIRLICSALEHAEGGLRRARVLIRGAHARRTLSTLNRNRQLLSIHA